MKESIIKYKDMSGIKIFSIFYMVFFLHTCFSEMQEFKDIHSLTINKEEALAFWCHHEDLRECDGDVGKPRLFFEPGGP